MRLQQCLCQQKQKQHKYGTQRPGSGPCLAAVAPANAVLKGVWKFSSHGSSFWDLELYFNVAKVSVKETQIPSLCWSVQWTVLTPVTVHICLAPKSSKVRPERNIAVSLPCIWDERPNWSGLPQIITFDLCWFSIIMSQRIKKDSF